MFGRKKEVEELLNENFKKYVVLAKQSDDRSVIAVNCDPFEMMAMFSVMFTQAPTMMEFIEKAIIIAKEELKNGTSKN